MGVPSRLCAVGACVSSVHHLGMALVWLFLSSDMLAGLIDVAYVGGGHDGELGPLPRPSNPNPSP